VLIPSGISLGMDNPSLKVSWTPVMNCRMLPALNRLDQDPRDEGMLTGTIGEEVRRRQLEVWSSLLYLVWRKQSSSIFFVEEVIKALSPFEPLGMDSGKCRLHTLLNTASLTHVARKIVHTLE
jgi:hypothetical protein